MKVLSFGSLNYDHVYEVPHFTEPKETQSSLSYQRNYGGKGLNQSIAMAKAQTALSYTVTLRDKFIEAYQQIMQIQV